MITSIKKKGTKNSKKKTYGYDNNKYLMENMFIKKKLDSEKRNI